MSTPPAPIPNHVAHFAIHAEDLARARAFYQAVFGWKFVAWGPPDFFMITGADGGSVGLLGSLTKRTTSRTGNAGDEPMTGFECTIAVADVDKTAKAVANAGGTVTMKKVTIDGVGHLIKFRDPEGNLVCAMHYDASAA